MIHNKNRGNTLITVIFDRITPSQSRDQHLNDETGCGENTRSRSATLYGFWRNGVSTRGLVSPDVKITLISGRDATATLASSSPPMPGMWISVNRMEIGELFRNTAT